jgi:transcriptional regulator with XRE-family HTH domain
MSLIIEKEAFGMRLTHLLNGSDIGTSSPTSVAREFNRRYSGKPVSAQAVRKWLIGEAIPTNDKVRTLARWLRVSPYWLHYGESDKASLTTLLKLEQESSIYNEHPANLLLQDFQRLPPRQRAAIAEIIKALLKANEAL